MESAVRRATLADVASTAGVSHQTVSNVVHGRGRVGAATRVRVQAAIDELGFRPHAGAASLRSRRTGRIAHPVPTGELHGANPFMLEFIQALTAAAARRGQHLLLMPGDQGDAAALADLGRTVAVDAVILASVTPRDPRVTALLRSGVPFACFGRTGQDRTHAWADVDNRAALRAMTSRVIARGHRRPAFLGYQPQGAWDVDREAGYRDAMLEAGLVAVTATPRPTPEHVRQAIDALLDLPDRPQAIITGSDLLAAVVYTVAAARGMRIGEDLAVTGFDGSLVGRLLTPTLTTMAIPVAAVCEVLVDTVLAQIDASAEPVGRLLVPDLIVGASD